MKILTCPVAVLGVAVVVSLTGSAQQTVPFAGGIPVAPKGLAGKSQSGPNRTHRYVQQRRDIVTRHVFELE